MAGEEQQLPRMMIESVRVHRTHKADVVRDSPELRHQLGQFHAALAVPVEGEFARHDLRRGLDEGKLQVLGHGLRQGLAMMLLERGFRIEEFVLARPSLHEHEDDVLRLGLEVRLLGGQWVDIGQVGRREAVARKQVAECRHADPRSDVLEEVPP